MHSALGIVVSQKIIYAVLLIETEKGYKLSGNFIIRIPYILPIGRRLHYVRTFILDLIFSKKVDFLALRTAERSGGRVSYDRVELEGVVSELSAQAPIKEFFYGSLKDIAQKLDFTERISEFLSGKLDLPLVKNWRICSNTEMREAALAALASFNIKTPEI